MRAWRPSRISATTRPNAPPSSTQRRSSFAAAEAEAAHPVERTPTSRKSAIGTDQGDSRDALLPAREQQQPVGDQGGRDEPLGRRDPDPADPDLPHRPERRGQPERVERPARPDQAEQEQPPIAAAAAPYSAGSSPIAIPTATATASARREADPPTRPGQCERDRHGRDGGLSC